MSPAREPADSKVRHEAATRFDTNLVVEAGAGTGKTSLLVERLLNGVGTGRHILENAACIGFDHDQGTRTHARAAAG